METIEMKKSIAFLLVLSTVFALSAAMTFTGGFGYELTIPTDGSDISSTGYDDNTGTGGGLYLNATGDFFKVTYTGGFDYYNQTAIGYLYLDKALASAGIELPVTMTLQSGNSRVTALNVYANPNSNYAGRIRIDKSANLPLGLTVGYGSAFTTVLGYSFDTDASSNQIHNILLSTKVAPVDGITATASWTNRDQWSQYKGYTTDQVAVIGLSGTVELAKLVQDLPVDITVSAGASISDFSALGTSFGAVDIAVAKDAVGADFEYVYDQGTHGIAMNASYSVDDATAVYAGFGTDDVSNFSAGLWYYGKVAYTLSGCTYFAKLSGAGIGLGFDFSY
jgi:hypothetical protein